MEIYSETGYLIVMDPNYLQLATENDFQSIDFMKNPKQAAVKLEGKLFPDGSNDKIGLIILPDGPGTYYFDIDQVSFWDVEEKSMKNKTIFGVELGSFIIFDIKYIHNLINLFDIAELEKMGGKAYFNLLNTKVANEGKAILWYQSPVGIGDGWHEVKWEAFTKI